MATYLIGDIQGCFDELMTVLDKASFNKEKDTLWCLGDVVNRGPKSLSTLEFLYNLPNCHITLGNHDFHLLRAFYLNSELRDSDTLNDILNSPMADKLCSWLRSQPLIHYDDKLKIVLSHAGVYPYWDLNDAIKHARKIEAILQNGDFKELLANVFINLTDAWSEDLSIMDKNCFTINSLTIMRLIDTENKKLSKSKSNLNSTGSITPWFDIGNPSLNNLTVYFGHWSALEGITNHKQYICLDTGCVWGSSLTMIRLEDQVLFTSK